MASMTSPAIPGLRSFSVYKERQELIMKYAGELDTPSLVKLINSEGFDFRNVRRAHPLRLYRERIQQGNKRNHRMLLTLDRFL